MAPVAVSPETQRRRKIVGINAENVTNIASTDFPHHYPGEDHAWSLARFKKDLRVQFHKNDHREAAFSLVGVDASIANAFRRIMIDEIPTLAIERVYIQNNTSIVQDEVFAQRLGLVPLTGALKGLTWMSYKPRPIASLENDDDDPTLGADPDVSKEKEPEDVDTVVFKLRMKCTYHPDRKTTDTEPDQLYLNHNVYAKDMVYEPQGRHEEYFNDGEGVRPVHPNILLAKMRPGQEIDMTLHAVKGIGADHAKYSPVATATYRLLPTIDILKPIVGDDAVKFARCFPRGVIGLEDITEDDIATQDEETMTESQLEVGKKKAVVRNPMRDTVSRECLRHKEFEGKVKLGRVQDHFIFNVESTGQFDSDWLFLESVKILRGKCTALRRDLGNVLR